MPEWALRSTRGTVAVVGAQDGIAVVTVVGNDESVSYGIDTASGALRWTHPGLEAVAVGTTMVTGLLDGEPMTPFPVGVDLATGSEKWRGEKTYGAAMEGAGAGTVRVSGQSGGKKHDRLLDVTSGQPRADMPPGMGSMSCSFDQIQTLACAHSFAVAAVDPASGKLLWALKDGEGTASRRRWEDSRLSSYPAGG